MQCDPNTNGKQTTEDIIIAVSQVHCSSAFIAMNLLIKTKERISTRCAMQEAGMSVAVTYQPRKDKTGIKKTVVSDCEY